MITYSMMSKKGNRDINEDSMDFVLRVNIHCFILADGLGGHGKGELASRYAVKKASHFLGTHKLDEGNMKALFQYCQKELRKEQKKLNLSKEMKTTMAVLCIENNKFVYRAHVGDTRIYRFSKWGSVERTHDHSVPQMLVLSRQIKENEIRFHEDRNRLLRVLGGEGNKELGEIQKTIKYKKGDCYLLCTDGFWEWIKEKEMKECLRKTESPDRWLEAMGKIVEKKGANSVMDNYSAVAIFIK